MLATMSVTRKRVLVNTPGQMEKVMTESGKMGNSMEKVRTHIKVVKHDRAFGTKAKEKIGSKMKSVRAFSI